MANIAKVTMPQLGESVTEGTIGAWLKQPGDKVEKYESLAEVITDKVNAEIPSPYTGTIKELLVPENEPVPNGTLICTIETEADVSDAPAPHAPAPAAPAPAPVPAPVSVATAPASVAAPAPAAAVAVAAPPAPAQSGGNGVSAGAGSKRLSPAVARLLEEHNLDLNQIPGTGLEGRVTKLDVDRYLEMRAAGTLPAPAPAQPAAPAPAPVAAAPAPTQPAPVPGAAHAEIGMRSPYEPTESMPTPAIPAPAAPAAAPAPAPPALPAVFAGSGDQVVPWTQMRAAIAKHMVQSVQTSPHAWTYVEIDMNNVMKYRAHIKEQFRAREGRDPSVLAFGIMALVQAVRQHPTINAAWSEQGIVLKRDINVGIPIDLGDQGLIVPVVAHADSQSFVGLTRTVGDLAARARSGKLRIDDIQGSTVTLNNAGTFGSMMSFPILNQPNVVNITMEAIVKRPVVIDDAIAIRPMMNMCCSFDHRVLDGAQVGRFLQTMKHLLEGMQDAGLGY